MSKMETIDADDDKLRQEQLKAIIALYPEIMEKTSREDPESIDDALAKKIRAVSHEMTIADKEMAIYDLFLLSITVLQVDPDVAIQAIRTLYSYAMSGEDSVIIVLERN